MGNTKLDSLELAEKYDELSDSQFDNGLTLIEKLDIKHSDNVLDLGCGTGRLTLHISEIVPEGKILGIDPSSQRIQIAKRKLNNNHSNIAFELGGSDDLYRYEDNTFDIIYLNAVLHWVKNKEYLFEHAYRILKPGGMLGLTTGNKDSPPTFRTITKEVLNRRSITEKPESVPVNPGELKSLLLKNEFNINEISLIKDPRYFNTSLQCLEYIEASSFGTFLSDIPENIKDDIKKDIMLEFENRRTTKGIENVYNLMYGVAEKAK